MVRRAQSLGNETGKVRHPHPPAGRRDPQKDGPSARHRDLFRLVSVLTGIPVLAVTWPWRPETHRGEVLPIGGLRRSCWPRCAAASAGRWIPRRTSRISPRSPTTPNERAGDHSGPSGSTRFRARPRAHARSRCPEAAQADVAAVAQLRGRHPTTAGVVKSKPLQQASEKAPVSHRPFCLPSAHHQEKLHTRIKRLLGALGVLVATGSAFVARILANSRDDAGPRPGTALRQEMLGNLLAINEGDPCSPRAARQRGQLAEEKLGSCVDKHRTQPLEARPAPTCQRRCTRSAWWGTARFQISPTLPAGDRRRRWPACRASPPAACGLPPRLPPALASGQLAPPPSGLMVSVARCPRPAARTG